MQFRFKETSVDKGQDTVWVTPLKFADAEYENLTNALYDQLQARLEAEGWEVVPRDAVTGSKANASDEVGKNEVENGLRVRVAPTGLKTLPVVSGRLKNLQRVAAINAEIGTDATVAAYVNSGICSVEPTKKTGMRSGTYASLKGDAWKWSGWDRRPLLGGGSPLRSSSATWRQQPGRRPPGARRSGCRECRCRPLRARRRSPCAGRARWPGSPRTCPTPSRRSRESWPRGP